MSEFSNCFRYFTCTRNARSSNLWNDLLLNKYGFAVFVFFFKKVLKIIFLKKYVYNEIVFQTNNSQIISKKYDFI